MRFERFDTPPILCQKEQLKPHPIFTISCGIKQPFARVLRSSSTVKMIHRAIHRNTSFRWLMVYHTHMYTHVHTHVYTYVHIHVHIHIHTQMNMHMHTCVYTCTPMYTHTHTHMYIHMYTHTCTQSHLNKVLRTIAKHYGP